MAEREGLIEGRIEVVAMERRRAALNADHAAGATALVVDVGRGVFAKAGGLVKVNDVVYNYTDYTEADDDVTATFTLAVGLTSAADDGDWVNAYDPLYQAIATDLTAQVRLPSAVDNDDLLHATFAQHLADKIGEDIRGLPGEQCLMERDHDTWRIVDILGLSDPDTGLGGPKWEADDRHVLSSADVTAGTVTFPLTFEPIAESLVAFWGVLPQRPTEYTIDYTSRTVTWPLAGVELAGDTLWVHYAHRGGIAPNSVGWEEPDWRYLQVTEGDSTDRSAPGFDDSSWTVGRGAFGNQVSEDGSLFVEFPPAWNPPHTVLGPPVDIGLWIRRRLPQVPSAAEVTVLVRLDGDCTVYWNGNLVDTRSSDGTSDSAPMTVPAGYLGGDNILAIHLVDDASDPGFDFLYIDARVEWA